MTALAGLATTSPAAIRFTTSVSSRRMAGASPPATAAAAAAGVDAAAMGAGAGVGVLLGLLGLPPCCCRSSASSAPVGCPPLMNSAGPGVGPAARLCGCV